MSRRIARLATGVALALLWLAPSASAEASVGAGLWSADHKATVTDCGSFGRDTNNFCFIDDAGSVELGVKFTTSKAVNLVGVRAYRTDAGAVKGSLWTSAGTRLAGPADFAGTATHGWQDVEFSGPVVVAPGQTYIASYFAPNADYAFQWKYFGDSLADPPTSTPYTVGPITALGSVSGDGNGVFCYDVASCFPADTYRDSNYWVTPLWAYRFDGFYQPVDVGVWNGAKAGSGIPVKFSLGGDQGLDVIKNGFPKATAIACPGASTPVDAVEETVAAGASDLSYDASSGQYVYVWKTDKKWANQCYQFELGLSDDTPHTFKVKFS